MTLWTPPLLVLSACSEPGMSCPDYPNYQIFIQVSSMPGALCSVTVSGADRDASYAFPALTECVNGNPPGSPCTAQGDSPRPPTCEVAGCDLIIRFPDTTGNALLNYLGQDTFAYTVRCDAAVVETGTVEPDLACGL